MTARLASTTSLVTLAIAAAIAASHPAAAQTTTWNTAFTGTSVPNGETYVFVDGGSITPSGNPTGTLSIGTSFPSGTSSVLQFSYGGSGTSSAKLTGFGSVIVDGPGSILMTNSGAGDANTFVGNLVLRSGTLIVVAAVASGNGSTVFEGGALRYAIQNGWNAPITITNQGGVFDASPSNGSNSINNTISGTGIWTLIGSGTASAASDGVNITYVNPTCNFTGTTTITGGKVNPTQDNVFGDSTQIGGSQANNKVILDGGSLFVPAGTIRNFPTAVEVGANGGYVDVLSSGQRGEMRFNAPISGTGQLTMLGGGLVVLSTSNAFSGTLVTSTTSGATLTLSNVNALRNAELNMVMPDSNGIFGAGFGTYFLGGLSGSTSINGFGSRAFDIGGNGRSTTFSGNLNNMPTLTKSGTGTLTLTGTTVLFNNQTGQSGITTITGGVLAVNSDLALGAQSLGSLVSSTATVTLNGGTLKQTVAFNSARAFTIQSAGGGIDTSAVGSTAVATLSGGFTGSGNLTLTANGDLTGSGTGNLALTGANTYTGTTTITSGMVSAASSLGNAANTLVLNGGGLIALGGTRTNSYATVIGLDRATLKASAASDVLNQAAVMSGSGGLRASGDGTVNLQAANTFSGETRTLSGTMNLAHANALQNSLLDMNAADTGVVGFTAGTTTYNVAGLTGSRGITFSSGTLSVGASNASTTYSGPLSGSGRLVKVGSGDLTLTGSNSYAGGTVVSAGRLVGTTDGLKGAITNDAAVEFAQATAGTYAGNMTGTGSLTKTGGGALTLSGTLSHSGGTVVSAGSLIGTTASLQGGITNNAAVEFAQATAGTYAGTMTGSGSVTKSGAGALTLSSNNSYAGTTTVSAGTLLINGNQAAATGGLAVLAGATLGGSGTSGGSMSLADGSTLSPGNSPGTFTSASGTWAGGANYNWQLVDAAGTAGTDWDLADFSGALDITATSGTPFKVNLWTLSGTGPDVNGNASNFNANANYSWRIATAAGGVTGFAANKFQVNASGTNGTAGFANAVGSGQFSVANTGNDVNVVFTPAIVFNVPSGTETQTQQGASANIGSAVSVTKTGTGAVVLDGNNTYSAVTAVDAGSLIVTGTLANSVVAVASGATLGGDGQVGQQVTISNGGTLSPGAAPTGVGILELGGLSLGTSATTVMRIADTGTTPGTDFDQVSILGSGALGFGGTLDLSTSNIDSASVGTSYRLFDFSVTPTGDFTSLTPLGGIYSGITWSGPVGGVWTSTNGTGGNYLTFSQGTGTLAVVPEPSTLALAAVAGLGGLAAFRRRWKA